MLHAVAESHAVEGRRLLDAGDAASLRHAALEARMAIELLFYALLPHYTEELPDDLARRWHPKQIIEALLERAFAIEAVSSESEGPGDDHARSSAEAES